MTTPSTSGSSEVAPSSATNSIDRPRASALARAELVDSPTRSGTTIGGVSGAPIAERHKLTVGAANVATRTATPTAPAATSPHLATLVHAPDGSGAGSTTGRGPTRDTVGSMLCSV